MPTRSGGFSSGMLGARGWLLALRIEVVDDAGALGLPALVEPGGAAGGDERCDQQRGEGLCGSWCASGSGPVSAHLFEGDVVDLAGAEQRQRRPG